MWNLRNSISNSSEGVLGCTLQDPSDKRTILCDDKLQDLFGCKTFIGFEVAKLLKEHFVKE